MKVGAFDSSSYPLTGPFYLESSVSAVPDWLESDRIIDESWVRLARV
jgi:hypothetical protein